MSSSPAVIAVDARLLVLCLLLAFVTAALSVRIRVAEDEAQAALARVSELNERLRETESFVAFAKPLWPELPE